MVSPLRSAGTPPGTPGITTDAPAIRDDGPPTAPARVAGSALAPQFAETSRGYNAETYFWVGCNRQCPTESVDVAGINFPKVTEKLQRVPGQPGKFTRVPRIGSIVALTKQQVLRLIADLPRKIVHVVPDEAAEAAAAAAEAADLAGGRIKRPKGDDVERPRRGFVRTIPSEAEQKVQQERGRFRPFVHKEGDRPAAEFLFCVPCENQVEPLPGLAYPSTLSVTGIEVPK